MQIQYTAYMYIGEGEHVCMYVYSDRPRDDDYLRNLQDNSICNMSCLATISLDYNSTIAFACTQKGRQAHSTIMMAKIETEKEYEYDHCGHFINFILYLAFCIPSCDIQR